MIPSPERQAEFLTTMPNAIVATIKRDGRPQVTPSWYLWTGEVFWVVTAGVTAKAHNLRRDARVVLCIDDPASGDYVQVIGDAEVIAGEAAREPALALIRKYMDAEVAVPHWETISARAAQVLVEIRPERFLWHDH